MRMLLIGTKEVKDFDMSAHQAGNFKESKTVEEKAKEAKQKRLEEEEDSDEEGDE